MLTLISYIQFLISVIAMDFKNFPLVVKKPFATIPIYFHMEMT